MAFFFISYNHNDRQTTEDLVSRLRHHGRTAWWDGEKRTDEFWRTVVAAELGKCSAVVVLASQNSLRSEEVLSEVVTAKKWRKKLLAVILGPLDDKGTAFGHAIADLPHLDARTGTISDDVFDALLEVASVSEIPHQLPECPILPAEERAHLEARGTPNIGPTIRRICLKHFAECLGGKSSKLGEAKIVLGEMRKHGLSVQRELDDWLAWRSWYEALRRCQPWSAALKALGDGLPNSSMPDFVTTTLRDEWLRQRDWALDCLKEALLSSQQETIGQAFASLEVFNAAHLDILREQRLPDAALPPPAFHEWARSALETIPGLTDENPSEFIAVRESPVPPPSSRLRALEERWRGYLKRQSDAALCVAQLREWRTSTTAQRVADAVESRLVTIDLPNLEAVQAAARAWEDVVAVLGHSRGATAVDAGLDAVTRAFPSVEPWARGRRSFFSLRAQRPIDITRWREWLEEYRRLTAELAHLVEGMRADSDDEWLTTLATSVQGEVRALGLERNILDVAQKLLCHAMHDARTGILEGEAELERVAAPDLWRSTLGSWAKLAAALQDAFTILTSMLGAHETPSPPAMAPAYLELSDESAADLRAALNRAHAAQQELGAGDDPYGELAESILHPWDDLAVRLEKALPIWRSVTKRVEELRFEQAEDGVRRLCELVPDAAILSDFLERWRTGEAPFHSWIDDFEKGRWDKAKERLDGLMAMYDTFLTTRRVEGAPFFEVFAQEFVRNRKAELQTPRADCLTAIEHQAALEKALKAAEGGNYEEMRAVRAVCEASSALPTALLELADVSSRLVQASSELEERCVELEQTHIGPDLKTGFPPEPEVLESETQRLNAIEKLITAMANDVEELQTRWAITVRPAAKIAGRLRDRRTNLESVTQYRGLKFFELLEHVQGEGWTSHQHWDTLIREMQRFLSSEPAEPIADAGDTILETLQVGRTLSMGLSGRQNPAVQRRLLGEHDLSHPLLKGFRALREQLDGPLHARLLKLLDAARRVVAQGECPTDIAGGLRFPFVEDGAAVPAIRAWVKDVEHQYVRQDDAGPHSINPKREIDRLATAAVSGRNWVAILAAAGEVLEVGAQLRNHRDLLPHHIGVAFLATDRRDAASRPDEATVAALGAWALLAAAADADNTRHLRQAVPAPLLAQRADGLSISRAAQSAFESIGIPWGSVTQPGSWANRWQLERKAVNQVVRLASQTTLPANLRWPMGPGLAAFYQLTRDVGDFVAEDDEAAQWFGPDADVAAMLHALEPEAALALIKERLAASAPTTSGRMRLKYEALRQLLDRTLGPHGTRGDEPRLAEWAEDYAATLFHCLDARRAIERLEVFFTILKGQISDRPAAEIVEAEARLGCMDAMVRALEQCKSPDLETRLWRLRKVRSDLRLTTVHDLYFPRWTKGFDPALMQQMLKQMDWAQEDAPGVFNVRMTRAYLRWVWASTSEDIGRQEQVRGEIERLFYETKDMQAKTEIQELLDISQNTQSSARWLRRLYAQKVFKS